MNLRCKPIILVSLVCISVLAGCVKNDSEDCATQGVHIHFYTKTICETDTIYEQDIDDLTYGVFDNEGILVASTRSSDVDLEEDYFQNLEVSSGLYTVVAWSGIEEKYYEVANLRNGITTKNDILLRLRRDGNRAYSIAGTRAFYGESPAVYVPENSFSEPLFVDIGVNMQEITNRVTIIVDGLYPAKDFDIDIETDNGTMRIDGTIATDQVMECGVEYEPAEDLLEARFTLLKLETGRTNIIVIRNNVSGVELFRGNLLGTLLLKNPEVNLDCDHDFVIHFTAEDQCNCGEIIIQEIRVNNWLVHSYQKEM